FKPVHIVYGFITHVARDHVEIAATAAKTVDPARTTQYHRQVVQVQRVEGGSLGIEKGGILGIRHFGCADAVGVGNAAKILNSWVVTISIAWVVGIARIADRDSGNRDAPYVARADSEHDQKNGNAHQVSLILKKDRVGAIREPQKKGQTY